MGAVTMRRPGLAVISLLPRPDRVHFLERVARGLPDVELHSLFLRRGTFLGRRAGVSPEINPVVFGASDVTESRPSRGVPIWADWANGGRAIAYLREHRVGMVILNGYRSVALLRALAWCRRAGVPVLLRADSNIESERAAHPSAVFRGLKRLIVGPVVRSCDAVMPMGELGVRYFEQYGATRDLCFYSPNVTDFERFSGVCESEAARFRERHGLGQDRKRILICGRMVPIKRFDLVIDAFAAFGARHPEWDLVGVGTGPLEGELRARVPSGMPDRVHWLGMIPWEELPAAYACAHVFVLPSDIEPWGIVLQEAMLAGNAAIATRVTQAADEIIEDGVSGRLIEPGSVTALLAALEDVCDPEHLDAYRENARRAMDAWLERRDPVAWIRRALEHFGVTAGAPACDAEGAPA
jgi:glycosyltransferase involved in cell wall biosynthesis